MLGSADPGAQTSGFWWFLAFVFYSVILAVVGWLVAGRSQTTAMQIRVPRLIGLLDDGTSTGRVQMRAYWELELAHLKPEAERLGMRTNRATTKKEVVRWLIEKEFPWLVLVNAEVM